MVAFFLGSHPEVSLAEIRSLLHVKEQFVSKAIAFFDVDRTNEELTTLFFKLGGSTRVARVIEEYVGEVTEERVLHALVSSLSNKDRKEYVLSLFGVMIDKKYLHSQVKEALPGSKYDGNIKEPQHVPAAIFHVVKRGGVEYSLIPIGDRVLLLESLHISDPEYWSKIDGERPGRDMKIGILPAKLARIMVNLSGVQEGEGILWDPFVGQATIAMQAAVLGISVFGSDKARQSIELGKKNMEWLYKSGLAQHKEVTLEVQAVEEARPGRGVKGIATEPFLGRPHFKPFPTLMNAKKEWKSIQNIYIALFRQATKFIPRGGRLVVIKPQFAFLEGRARQWYNPPLSTVTDSWKVPEEIKDLGTLSWIQRDSVVGRTIEVFERK